MREKGNGGVGRSTENKGRENKQMSDPGHMMGEV